MYGFSMKRDEKNFNCKNQIWHFIYSFSLLHQ